MALLWLVPSTALATALPSTIKENTTLTAAGSPYTGETTIEPAATLTVKPGAGFTGIRIVVKGTLDAEGTSAEPITFTKSTGRYQGIFFEPGSGASVLNHVEVSESGNSTWGTPEVEARASHPTIENSTFSSSASAAISTGEGGAPHIADNHISNCGAYGAGIAYSASGKTPGEVDIHGNQVANCPKGILVSASLDPEIIGTSLGENTITGSTETALSAGGIPLPGDITSNTLTGNKSNLIIASGTVAHSETWANGGTLVEPTVTVNSGATLTIEPGLNFIHPQFNVKGTLDAEGTSAEPITFTKSTGRYQGIFFEPGSGASVLNHVEVSESGNSTWGTPEVEARASHPTIENSTFSSSASAAISTGEGGAPHIADNHISNCGAYGAGIAYSASGKTPGEVDIHGNQVANCPKGILVSASLDPEIIGTSLGENTITGSTETALSAGGIPLPGDITSNTLTGNKSNLIIASGTVAHSETWANGGTLVEPTVTVNSGATLTIEPGLNFIHPQFNVKGTLDAEGTSAEPITFTKSTGRYQGIFFEPGSGASVLNHVEVSESGNSTWGTPEVEARASHPTIENSTFSSSASAAISTGEGGAPHIADNHISNCGAYGAGIAYSASGKTPGEVDIHGNQVANCPKGILVSASLDPEIIGTSLGENTITGSTETALSAGGIPLPGDITSNTLTGNKSNLIIASGTVAHSETWANGGTLVEPTVTVNSGATLTIEPGLNFIHPQFNVKGTLDAEGTSAEPITFTKSTGRYQGIFFEPGSGASVLNHVEVSESGNSTWGTPEVEARASHPTIENSTFRASPSTAIYVTESGSPKIEWNRFRNNTSGLAYSGTGKLPAPNNDWECASGPKPAGCGNSVTSNIEWKPAVQLPELAGHCRGKESQCGEGADPVSLATGQLDYSHQDLLLTNKSAEPLEFTRAYTSGSSSDTGLGPGWSQTGLASAIELESGKEVLVLRQDGRQDIFLKTESGYTAPSGVTDTLVKVEGTFQLTTLQGTVYRFDSSGRIASITDSHGLKTTYTYSGEGRLSTITDPSSQTLTFAYNGSNHITSVKDSTGREVKFAYSAAGDLETVTDALGGVTKYAYDSQHRLTSITDPRKNVILKNVYDGQGRIIEQRDGLEHLWKLEYGAGETTVTEPEGGKRKYGFDSQNRVVSETDQLGNKTTIAYDEGGNVHEVVKPGGAKWTYGHDAAGNLTSIKDPEGGERRYEYNAQNRPISFTDARSSAWGYEWSKAGDLLKITDPEKGETTLTYNESGQPLTKTDPDKHKAEFSYDTRGNELSETDPLGHKTSFEYDSRNDLIAKTAPGLKAEKFERDAYGDLLARTTPEGHKTKYSYDANGLPTQITDPGEDVWKIEYNAMERPTVYTDPLEQQIKTTYNGDLKPTKVVNRRGKETTYSYDLANQLTEVKRPEGEAWHFGYDTRGNRTSVVDPREHETTYAYDLLNRMTKVSEPLGTTTEYGHDANGDVTSIKDPRGYATSYEYDKLGHLTEVAQPLEKTTTYSYDAAGNLLTKTTAAGTLEYAYDAGDHLAEVKAGESTLRALGYNADNLLSSATDAEGHKIEVGYNEDGLISSVKDGRGQSLTRSYNSRGLLAKQVDGRGTLEYGYDKLGRLSSLTDPQGKALSFGYNPEGDLTEVKRPNGVTTTSVYNEAGRLAETTAVKAGEPPTTLESLKYGYDATGNVTSKLDQRLEAETTYTYDALNRLTEFNPPGEATTSYGYDKAGNRTEAGSTTFSFNALNQLTEASDGTTYSYDGAGRMTGKVKGVEETSYEWTPLDHLAKVEGPSETASYAYDGLERLSERKSGSGIQVFHYGDLSDLSTYVANGEGKVTTSYVQGAHGLTEQRSGEVTNFPLADGHGDIAAIAGPTGSIESREEYGPWGEPLSGPSLEMGYLGAYERPTDSTTGLIQMGARNYDPSLGSFASEDPVFGHLGLGESVDRYLYVRNSPLNAYDLNGRDACVPTPFGEACAGQAAEDVGNAGHDLWNLTRPGRHFIANRAEDFVKLAKKAASDFEASEDSLGETTEEFGSWSSKSVDCLWKTITEPSKHQRCLPELHEYKPDEFEYEPPEMKPPPAAGP